jgi:hypothetical protein
MVSPSTVMVRPPGSPLAIFAARAQEGNEKQRPAQKVPGRFAEPDRGRAREIVPAFLLT